MAKRMTKMEACHHLTLVKNESIEDIERMREYLKEKTDSDHKLYYTKRIAEVEARIRAIEMAGTALTR